ncbi:hypothetical protein CXB51_034791 [Gossypium anomalum]|uniref:Uncharacterized protein n=1 Tax=Gossypium anomalum TaxID=47600 RepID=A0A8J5Y8R3_9ROSI|nr:hypothetical protein CXB51_034791 [Gossypium anomalum]
MTENQDNQLPPAILAELANQNPAHCTMYDYAKPNLTGTESSIVRPAIADENPNTHLASFLEFCDTFKLMAFLRMPSVFNGLRNTLRCMGEIQRPTAKVPSPWVTSMATSSNVLQWCESLDRQMIDAAAGGTINNKTPEEAYKFIEEMSLNNYQWQVMRTKPTETVGVYNVDSVHLVMRCDSSGGGVHTEYQPFNPTTEEEQVNYMGNNNFRSQNNPYSNTYNAGWKNHPNFSWGDQGNQRPQNPQGFQQPPYQQEKKLSLEDLPSNTEPNPREQLNTINVQDKEGFVEPEPGPRQENVVSKGNGEGSHNENKTVKVEYKPRVPYPNATRKDRSDEYFGKFLKVLKKLHINLPFIEALSQMPNAMKFLRKLLANKRKLDEASHVVLNALCSAILQNKLPYKLKDPGSFTIPYLIDKTIRIPRGIIEDVLVKIDKFMFAVDFIVLDIEEDNNTSLILGRPFLATTKTIIDVGTGELTLRVGDKMITLQARNSGNTSNIKVKVSHPKFGTFKVNNTYLKPYLDKIDSRNEEYELLKPP